MKHIKKLTEIKFHLTIKMSLKKLKYYKYMLYNLFEYLNQTMIFLAQAYLNTFLLELLWQL